MYFETTVLVLFLDVYILCDLQPLVEDEVFLNLTEFTYLYFRNYSTINFLCDDEEFSDLIQNKNELFSYTINTKNTTCFGQSPNREGFVIMANLTGMILNYIRRIKMNKFGVIKRSLIVTRPQVDYLIIFKYAYKFSFQKILIVEVNERNELEIIKYDYFSKLLTRLNVWEYEISDYEERFLNLQNYVIRTSSVESKPSFVKSKFGYQGVDPSFVHLIADKLNFSIVFTNVTSFGARESKRKITGAFGALYRKEIDFIFNQIFVKEYNMTGIAFTNTISEDRLCVVAPKAKNNGKWITISQCCRKTVWSLLLLFYLITISGLYIMTKLKQERHHSPCYKILTAVINLFQIFFDVCPKFPLTKIWEKIFLITVLLFVVIQKTMFQSSLYRALTVPMPPKYIQTLEELADTNFYISTNSKSLQDTFSASHKPYMKQLQNRLKILPKSTPKYPVFLSRQTTNDYNQLVNFNRDGYVKTYTIPECPQKYTLAYLTRKDSILADTINDLVGHIVAGGFVGKWYSDMLYNVSMYIPPVKPETIVYPRKFNFQDLESYFLVLLLGLLISVIVFIIELIYIRAIRTK